MTPYQRRQGPSLPTGEPLNAPSSFPLGGRGKLRAVGWTRKMSILDVGGGRCGKLGAKASVTGTPAVASSGKAFTASPRPSARSRAEVAAAAAVWWGPHRRRRRIHPHGNCPDGIRPPPSQLAAARPRHHRRPQLPQHMDNSHRNRPPLLWAARVRSANRQPWIRPRRDRPRWPRSAPSRAAVSRGRIGVTRPRHHRPRSPPAPSQARIRGGGRRQRRPALQILREGEVGRGGSCSGWGRLPSGRRRDGRRPQRRRGGGRHVQHITRPSLAIRAREGREGDGGRKGGRGGRGGGGRSGWRRRHGGGRQVRLGFRDMLPT